MAKARSRCSIFLRTSYFLPIYLRHAQRNSPRQRFRLSNYILIGAYQCWFAILFFRYHSSIFKEDFIVFDTRWIWTIDCIMGLMPFVFNYHVRTFILRQSLPNKNMIYYGTNPDVMWLIQRYSYLEIPTKCQCLSCITISIPTIGLLIPLLMLNTAIILSLRYQINIGTRS